MTSTASPVRTSRASQAAVASTEPVANDVSPGLRRAVAAYLDAERAAYNQKLAQALPSLTALDEDAYARDHFPAEDPARMAATLRSVKKPCLAFKILAAGRRRRRA